MDRTTLPTRRDAVRGVFPVIFLCLVLPLSLVACGGGAGNDDPANPLPGSGVDTTAPTVTVTSPANDSTISGTVVISATVSDPSTPGETASGVAGVQFKVDDVNFGPEDTASPYSVPWDTNAMANGGHTVAAVVRDHAGNKATATVTVTVDNSSPPGGGGGLAMPSLDDERNTYKAWGWTWTADKEPNFPDDSTYYVTHPDVHGDTEGDDLWTYLMMYRRTGQKGYWDRAQAWARYFKEEYRTSAEFDFDRGYLLDHLYGWGLVAWYEDTGDAAALAEAENIAAEVETYWNQLDSTGNPKFVPGRYAMSEYGLRQGARHLLLAVRVAEATGKPRWINLRDKLIDLWLQSPDWDATRGMYFTGSWYTNEDVAPDTNCKYSGDASCPYQQGARIVPSFHIGILTEAFDQAYRTTGRTALRDRMVAMAQFVDKYGLDETYQYTGKTFGIVDGKPWHSYSAASPVTFWDPVYTTSLVNTLVRGYRYTGNRYYYDRAKYFFNRGTKGVYGSPTARSAGDTEVDHFIDTKFASSTGFFYLDYNKGELQYTYLIFKPLL